MNKGVIDELVNVTKYAAAEGRFAFEALQIFRREGVLGLSVPERYGGKPTSLRDEIRAIYHAGRASASLGTILGMHLQQVRAIVDYGSETLKQAVLPEIAKGQIYIGSITTEAGSGGDLRASATSIKRHYDEIVLYRHAPIVTGGEAADAFLVKMTDETDGTLGNVLVYVPRQLASVEVRPNSWDPLGMRETGSVQLVLKASVPQDHLIESFDTVVSESFGPYAHLGWAATWLGCASACGDRLITALRDAPSLRRKIMDSELALARLAQARAELDAVRDALLATVQMFESGNRDRMTFAIRVNDLKIAAANKCFNAVNLMVELGGLSHGYMKTSKTQIEKAFRDLRSASLNYSNDRLSTENGKILMRLGFEGIEP